MNRKERILAAIKHEPVDRLPTDYWGTEEATQNLRDYLGTDDIYEALDIDGIAGATPPYVGPERIDTETYREDAWSMGYRAQVYETGTYFEQVTYPLADAETIEDLDAYEWPDPDWWDYGALPEMLEERADRATQVGYTAPFYYHNKLRGLELSLMDPILRPAFTRELVRRISDFFTEYHRRCFKAAPGLIDTTQVTDDFGSQTGLLISPQIFDDFYRESVQRGIDLAKSFDILVFHHDDGDMRALLPRLVEMGIDILNPIQWRCGNWDLAALKRDWGDRICFHSAVDNQITLPFGTVEDVRAEVKMLAETLGADRTGFIIGPCHNVQANTPPENVVAMYEAAHKYG
jgi:uroporphyrinogen decarboxylase